MNTKIFLDSGDPADTTVAIDILGYLDGQTTNPSLVAQNPKIKNKLQNNIKLSKSELLDEYREIVTQISNLIPKGSVSIEVYADRNSDIESMYRQAIEMNSWISNAHIKFPIITSGLHVAKKVFEQNINVNMTLCFDQNHATATDIALQSSDKSRAFISPFIGRLDDQGFNGLDLIKNIMLQYKHNNSNISVLAASIRTIEHLLCCLALKVDIVTVPLKIIQQWEIYDFIIPMDLNEVENILREINYKNLKNINYIDTQDLYTKKYFEIDLNNELTNVGLQKFADDWNNLLTI
jgi:transaldolase